MKMNLRIIIGLLGCSIWTSCTTTAIDESKLSQTPITFGTLVSRSAVTDSKEMDDFLVWGGYEGNNVFNGETVLKDANWGYTGGTRYWIADKSYKFYAIHPKFASDTKTIASVDGQGNFSVQNFNSSQSVDLMTASSPTMYGSSPETVKLSFNHELAWVELLGKMDAASVAAIAGFKVEVTAVSIYGMPVVADFVSGVWSSSQTPTDEITPFKSISGDPVQLSETKETSLLGDLLFVPQKITDKFCISITYKVYSSTNTNGSEITQTIPLATLGVEEWNKSIHYQYRFTISDTEHILFDRPEVAPWTDATGGTIVVE